MALAWAYSLDRVKLYRLRLRGQRSTQTSLNPDSHYWIRANWPARERAIWDASKQEQAQFLAANSHQIENINGPIPKLPVPSPSKTPGTPGANPPLTQLEKNWLKKHWGGEFHFLRCYGLKIYDEEDREEGRTILRSMMSPENSDEVDDGNSSENSFLPDLEEDPCSHVADYIFSEEELDCIKLNYGNSHKFLICHGLKFYDDGDCQEGKAIVQAQLKTTKKKKKKHEQKSEEVVEEVYLPTVFIDGEY